MTRSALTVQECCVNCRQPVGRCRDASCDDDSTYSGVLLRGEWQPIETQDGETRGRSARLRQVGSAGATVA
jgi:hypothetical protein